MGDRVEFEVEIAHVRVDEVPADWRQLLELAKKHRNTLGFLPNSAFADRLRRGTLIVARLNGQLVGYCLYDVPRSGYIKLVHVCVDRRGLGIGKRMINESVRAHPRAIGVVAYCRRDYVGLDRFWSSVGLAPRGERPGRALAGSVLTRWWMPLGELDLLEEAAFGAGRTLVAYDTNVVIDLYGSTDIDRADRDASRGLLADWVQAEITPVLSPQVDVELNRNSNDAERVLRDSGAAHLLRLRSTRQSQSRTYDAMIEADIQADLESDPSLRDDLLHVADAITAGVAYFVTNDSRLLRLSPRFLPPGEVLKIVRPHELIREIDSRLGQPAFQSRLIEDVDLEWVPAANIALDDLVATFATREQDERGNELRRRLRAAIARSPRTVRVLVDPEGKLWALLAEAIDDGLLRVELLRVASSRATNTVALQLARHTRHIARLNGVRSIEVVDPVMSEVSRQALVNDGFQRTTIFRADLIDAAIDVRSFEVLHPDVAVDSVGQIRDIERRFWPLVLLGSDIPTYIAPIHPRFTYPLFGIDRATLWGADRPRALGLSREHVYYSGSGKALPPRGSRIIWYATADATETVRQILAYSRGLGCERNTPEEAYRRNRQIGVLRRHHVREAADQRGRVTVVRFEDTEVLSRPIGGEELTALLDRYRVKQPIRSFRRVDSSLFEDLIRSQRRSSE